MHAMPLASTGLLNRVLRSTMALGVVATAIGLPNAHAQIPSPAPRSGESPSQWSLGLGVASGQKAYTGIDRDTNAVPLIQYEGKYFRIRGLGVEVMLPGVTISDTQSLEFSLIGRFSPGDGYKNDDAPILAGMAERKGGFWAGGKVEWKTSVVNVAADWTADASGDSKGQKFGLGITRPTRLGPQAMLIPRLGVTWQDKKYNNYYYGVRASEATATRAAYNADAGVNAEISLTGIYSFDRHHSAMLSAGVSTLSKEIKNSPIVDRSTENRLMVGYLYRF